jgi:hypothetical protein
MSDVNMCKCERPMPRHIGVHPTTCVKCKGVIE